MASLHTSPSTLPKPKTPNFLIILTDEERYPVPEENEELRHFRETQLLGRKMLRESGVTFHNHYTAATACTPSRASFFTGQYPTLHGVSETYGFAKGANDPRIAWLEPNTVPTMGDLFRRAGYETVYKGKWHISKADILDEHGEEIMSVTEDGKRIPETEDLYLKRQPLDEFGFQDWIGPEPHGAKIENGGINRDPTFSDQVCEYLGQREERIRSGEQVKPFLMVASLVNPHDVALYPQFKALGMDLCDETVPEVPAAPSDQEDLSTKPSPQKRYLEAFRSLYCAPEVHEMLFSCKEEMRRMYYYLHKLVDHDIRQMYGKLKDTSFFNDTVVIFTSDHGDMLGAHGNLLQKWTVAYQEAIHIPLIISAPFLPTGDVDFCTSAVDLIPTMLGLAGVDHHDLMHRMAETHSEAHPLVGNDFSSVLTLERGPETQFSNVAYFMTEDEVTKGNSQVSIRGGVEYDAVEGPCHIESIICFLEDRETGEREQWKFTRYFDNPERWSHPFKRDVCIIRQGPMRGRVVVRTTKHDDEFELYNLSRDPSELHNLAHPSVIDSLPAAERSRVISTAAVMAARLAQVAEERRKHRNSPRPARTITPTYLVESKL